MCGFTSSGTRLRGRAARGERLVDYAPQGHWKAITFVGGLQQGLNGGLVLGGTLDPAAGAGLKSA